MKFSVTKKWKIWLIIAVAVLAVGLILFGVLGYNQAAGNKDGYELKVSVSENFGDASAVMKKATDGFLSDSGIKSEGYAFYKLDGGRTLVYKFNGDVSAKLDESALISAVETALGEESEVLSGLEVTCDYSATKVIFDSQFGWALLALGIAAVAVFVYMFFMEKLAGAVTVIAVSVLSALLFVAVMGITRIPAYPFASAACALSAVCGAVLSSGLVSRFREEQKNVGNSKLSLAEVADKGTCSSVLRFGIVCGASLLAAILFVAIGPTYIRFMGLQLFAATVVSAFSSFAFSGIIWSAVKKGTPSKYTAKAKKENAETVKETGEAVAE